jgi:CheY-like chemotaxis protein
MKNKDKQKHVVMGERRILVVDDEEVVASLFTIALEELGYQISSFTESDKAFEQFRTAPYDFDLILTDESMPKLSGSELARRVRKIRPDIPVIICTGFGNKITQEMVEEIGLSKVILKPVGPEDLARNIREVLAKETTGKTEKCT